MKRKGDNVQYAVKEALIDSSFLLYGVSGAWSLKSVEQACSGPALLPVRDQHADLLDRLFGANCGIGQKPPLRPNMFGHCTERICGRSRHSAAEEDRSASSDLI